MASSDSDPKDHRAANAGLRLLTVAVALSVAAAGAWWALVGHATAGSGGASAAPPRAQSSAREPPTPKPVLTTQAEAQPTTAEVASPEPRERVRQAVGVPPPSPEALALLDKLRGEGIVVPADLRLRDASDWHTLEDLWAGMTKDVDDARRARHKLGKKITWARLERGPYVDHDASGLPRDEYGGVLGPWLDKNHPDEFITTKTLPPNIYREVRLKPGEDADFDLATRKHHDLRAFRKTETEALVATRAVHNDEGDQR